MADHLSLYIIMPDSVNKQLVYLIYILLGLSIGGFGQDYIHHKDKNNHYDSIDHIHDEIHEIKQKIKLLDRKYIDFNAE